MIALDNITQRTLQQVAHEVAKISEIVAEDLFADGIDSIRMDFDANTETLEGKALKVSFEIKASGKVHLHIL